MASHRNVSALLLKNSADSTSFEKNRKRCRKAFGGKHTLRVCPRLSLPRVTGTHEAALCAGKARRHPRFRRVTPPKHHHSSPRGSSSRHHRHAAALSTTDLGACSSLSASPPETRNGALTLETAMNGATVTARNEVMPLYLSVI